MIRPTGLAVLLGAFLVACQSTDNMSMGPSEPAAAPNTTVQATVISPISLAEDETGRVSTGGVSPDLNDPNTAIATLPLDFTGFRERLSSHARKFADLSVDGQFNAITKIGNLVVHQQGVIDCFTIIGNIARVEGRVLKQDGVDLGADAFRVFYTVEDGQEKPDAYSGLFNMVEGTQGAHCSVGNLAVMYTVETGNVQVRS